MRGGVNVTVLNSLVPACGDVLIAPFGMDRSVWAIIILVLFAAVITAAVILAVKAIKYLRRGKRK